MPSAEAAIGPRWLPWVAVALLLAVVVHIGRGYREEALSQTPALNDEALHVALLRATDEAFEHGLDPTDFWFPDVAFGYPVFHHYQHAPYVAVVAATRAWNAVAVVDPDESASDSTSGRVNPVAVWRWVAWLLVMVLPLSIAWSVWRFARDPIAGAFAGIAAAVVAAPHALYGGLDLNNFGWSGAGLTTQLWGAVLIGPVWVAIHRAITTGRGLVLAGAGIALTTVTHLFFGWLAAAVAVLFALVGPVASLGPRIGRLVVVGGLAFAMCAYFVVPLVVDREAMNRSVFEPAWKYDGLALTDAATRIADGRLFDYDSAGWYRGSLEGKADDGARFPVVTLLLAVGLVVSVVRGVRRRAVAPVLLVFVVAFALFGGRATWGGLVDWLPFGESMHFHRFLAPLHWAGVALAGIGAAQLVRWASARIGRPWVAPVVVLALAGGFVPAALERFDGAVEPDDRPLAPPGPGSGALDYRRLVLRSTWDAVRAGSTPIAALIHAAKTAGPGRAFAGPPSGWGRDYRLGALHVYDLLPAARMPSVGYTYHAMSLNADIAGAFDESRFAHHDLFNVRWRIAPTARLERDALPFVYPRNIQGSHSLAEVKTSGAFGLVRSAGAFAGSRADWFSVIHRWLGTAHVESGRFPVLFVDREPDGRFGEVTPLARLTDRIGTPDAPPSAPPSTRLGRIVGESVGPGRYEARLDVTTPCLAMLKETFHPRWRATVDGVAVEPVMVAPAFIAVPVDAGAHEVVFVYTPPAWRWPAALGGLVLAVVAGVGETWRRRRRGSVA